MDNEKIASELVKIAREIMAEAMPHELKSYIDKVAKHLSDNYDSGRIKVERWDPPGLKGTNHVVYTIKPAAGNFATFIGYNGKDGYVGPYYSSMFKFDSAKRTWTPADVSNDIANRMGIPKKGTSEFRSMDEFISDVKRLGFLKKGRGFAIQNKSVAGKDDDTYYSWAAPLSNKIWNLAKKSGLNVEGNYDKGHGVYYFEID